MPCNTATVGGLGGCAVSLSAPSHWEDSDVLKLRRVSISPYGGFDQGSDHGSHMTLRNILTLELCGIRRILD
jgi:hypothetical protein